MLLRIVALSGLIVLSLSAGARGQLLPVLEFAFQSDKPYGYDVTIKIDTKDFTDTHTGYALYRRQSTDAKGRIHLWHVSKLDPEQKRKPGSTVIVDALTTRSAGPDTMVVNRQGETQGAYLWKALPYILGFQSTLALERLPAVPGNQWHFEEETELVESGPLAMFGVVGGRKAKERSDYTLAEVRGDLVRVEKKYALNTVDKDDSQWRVAMTGAGSFQFQHREGVISSLSMDYRLVTRESASKPPYTITASVSVKGMSAERLKQVFDERDRQWKQLTGAVYAEGPRTPLDPAERVRLISGLRDKNPKLQEAAVIRLISAERDDRPADFSTHLAAILTNAHGELQLKAAQALIVWATPEVEAALVEATDDVGNFAVAPEGSGYPLAELAYRALDAIGTESAVRAIAQGIGSSTPAPKELLKRRGPSAEPALIELVANGDYFKQRAACNLLAEIGGPSAAPVLEQAYKKGTIRKEADAALKAVALRAGLSVDELLAKSRATATTVPAAGGGGAIPAAERGVRTWRDNTGSFQIDAELVSADGDSVKLKTREGKTINVPLARLSAADQELVAKLSRSTEPAATTVEAPPAPSTKEAVGGPGGIVFREASADGSTVVGVQFRARDWAGKPAIASFKPIYVRDVDATKTRDEIVVARDRYALGAIQVDADDLLVRAVRLVFMRVDGDRLDTSITYTSDWIGTPTGKAPVTLSGAGKPVLGFHGRRMARIHSLGIVGESDSP